MTKILLVSILNQNEAQLRGFLKNDISVTELFGSGLIPLGILSIEAYVRKMCSEVQVHTVSQNSRAYPILMQDTDYRKGLKEILRDFPGFLMEEIRSEIAEFAPDIIGLSILFDSTISVLEQTAREIRKLAPNSLIIAGGHPPTSLPKKLLGEMDLPLDAICLGEGEIPFAELACAKDKRRYLAESPYFVTRETLGQAHSRAYISDLDEIPPLHYEEMYSRYGGIENILYLHSNVLDKDHQFNRQGIVMTSRGCPYNCVFCASHAVHGKKMRYNSMARVKQEIDFWVDGYQVETIGIMDDHFLFDVPRAIEICDYIGSRGADMRFLNGLNISPINQDFVDCCVRNNVKEVQLALESGSEYTLHQIMHKPLSLEKAQQVFHMFNEAGIFVKVFLVLGFPDETWENIQESLAFCRRAEFSWATISTLAPVSGSALHEKLTDSGASFDNLLFSKTNLVPKAVREKANGDLRYAFNLDVNFKHNPYMRMGKYEQAAERFESIIHNYPQHAFAWYYLACCKQNMGWDCSKEMDRYREIVSNDLVWRGWAEYFELGNGEAQ